MSLVYWITCCFNDPLKSLLFICLPCPTQIYGFIKTICIPFHLITWCSEALSICVATVHIEWNFYNRQIVVIDKQQLWKKWKWIEERLLAPIICLELKPSHDSILNKKESCFCVGSETNCCACDKKGSTEEYRDEEAHKITCFIVSLKRCTICCCSRSLLTTTTTKTTMLYV